MKFGFFIAFSLVLGGKSLMKVFKSINNNIVSAFDNSGREVVVIGKGVGYKVSKGDEIATDKIDKVFVMSNSDNTERLKELLASLPTEYIQITDEILDFAKKNLGKKINEGAYFTLADHINFAVIRQKQGMQFHNILLREVRFFYPQEYGVGIYALKLMKERFGIDMPEDEAASIALHILNAEQDSTIGEAFHIVKLLDFLVETIEKIIDFKLDLDSYNVERFVTHLKFLARRIISKNCFIDIDNDFYEWIVAYYPKEKKWSERVAAKVQQQYDYELSKEEIGNLIIHLRRVSQYEMPTEI